MNEKFGLVDFCLCTLSLFGWGAIMFFVMLF